MSIRESFIGKDITTNKASMIKKCIETKTTIILIHAKWCGHCLTLRPEFEAFKKKTKHNIVEIESEAIPNLREHSDLYNKIIPKNESIYFPMIIIFIKQVGKPCESKIYEGPRTAAAMEEAVRVKPVIKSKKNESFLASKQLVSASISASKKIATISELASSKKTLSPIALASASKQLNKASKQLDKASKQLASKQKKAFKKKP